MNIWLVKYEQQRLLCQTCPGVSDCIEKHSISIPLTAPILLFPWICLALTTPEPTVPLRLGPATDLRQNASTGIPFGRQPDSS